VDIRVLPYVAGWHPGLVGGFVLDVAAYKKAVTDVLRVAMSADESIDLITREAKRLAGMT
jgi:hypothetical protein